MRGTTVCAAWLALLGTAGADAAIFEYTFATEFSASDSVGIKAVAVDCPAGTFALGGGGWVGGYREERGLLASESIGDTGSGVPTGWSARAREVDTDSNQWHLLVRAVCGRTAGLERVVAETASNSDSPKFVVAECPPGKSPLSGGFAIGGSVFGPVVETSVPALDVDSLEPYGWFARAHEAEDASAIWSLRAEVLCADMEVGIQRARDVTSIALPYRELIHVCPAGTIATGGGVDVTGPDADWLAATYHESASAWQIGVTRFPEEPNQTRLDSYVVCAEPTAGVLAATAVCALRRRRSAGMHGVR
jgi:hypothetical protein